VSGKKKLPIRRNPYTTSSGAELDKRARAAAKSVAPMLQPAAALSKQL